MANGILAWWGDKTLQDVNGRNCRAYVEWRISQRHAQRPKKGPFISTETARHELAVLRTAIRYYNREHGPLTAVPMVTMPPAKPAREDYFWSRDEAARRIRAARRRPEPHHILRMIMIGLYSGTRPGAMMKLRWLPSTDGGWIDLAGEIIHRRGLGVMQTTKRQPPCRIYKGLIRHLRKWHREDMAVGCRHVVHFREPIKECYDAWEHVRKDAGCDRRDSPHVLRHTAATWFMSWGLDVTLISAYLGMTIDVLMGVYAHHPQCSSRRSPNLRPGNRRTERERNGIG
jgi:integrase